MTFDRILEPLARLIRALTARIDYLALYPARVVAQNSDGSLELQPDDVRMPSLSGVPIRYGIPGVRATVATGARVLLGFEGGNPAAPVATLWEAASVTRLELDAGDIVLNGGTHEVARKGDHTAGHSHTAVFVLAAGTVPVEGTITITSATDSLAEGAAHVKA